MNQIKKTYKGGRKMKVKSLMIGAMVLCLMVSACGFMASVPWIRSASNNKIVNLGDSIFALSGDEQAYLHSWAGQTFRRYSTSGAEINGGDWIAPSVKNQYATARGDNSYIKTIFMDGGGNDILIPATALDPYNCKVDWWESGLSTSCKNLVNDIYVDSVNLLNQMGRDGVQNIIFQGYYYPKNGLIGSTTLKQVLDYGDNKLASAVTNATAVANHRVFIDPRTLGITNSDIIIDGIHPTSSGSYKLAVAMWNQLKYHLN
jgi:hypothetical protein